MRLTFVGPVPPLPGGISQHSARLIDELRQLGVEVDVYSWLDQYPRLLYKGSSRDETAVPMPGARFWLRWWNPWTWWRVRRAVRGTPVVFPYVTPFLALPLRVIIGAAPAAVAVVHNALPHERLPLQRVLGRLALAKASALVAHSERVADDLRSLGVDAPIVVLPHPPSLPVEPSPLPASPPLRLLFCGVVRPYKGLEVAIDALGEMRAKGLDVTLTVLGEFWEPVEAYRSAVAERGLSQHVDIRDGYASNEELIDTIAGHHILVAPYLDATQSGVVPLALGSGRPVVASDVGGIAEQVRDGLDGVLVAPSDPAALASGVMAVSGNLRSMADAAAETAASWSAMGEAVKEAIGGELAS